MVSSLRGQGTFTFSGVRVMVRVVRTAQVAFKHVVLALLADVYYCMPCKQKMTFCISLIAVVFSCACNRELSIQYIWR